MGVLTRRVAARLLSIASVVLLFIQIGIPRLSAAGESLLLAEPEPQYVVASALDSIYESNKQAVVLIAAELNISNGSPYTRAFGERFMFGKLESAYSIMRDVAKWILETGRIFREVKRLLFGAWENGGSTTFEYRVVGKGLLLDLDTGEWESTKGGMAIRVRHVTEYYNKIRYAYFMPTESGLTIYRRK